MPKEWILNSATNRFQLNFKRNVGATSEAIRKCSPSSLNEWRDYYFENVRTQEQIEELGKRLYSKITDVLLNEIAEITEEDCVDYIKNLVIYRTYSGYINEIKTIYELLQVELGVEILPAPDEWDRLFNVDFYIQINDKYLGLQVKPVSLAPNIHEIFKEKNIQLATHKSFTEKYGGKVFYLYSYKSGDKAIIANTEIVPEIKKEIERLSQ